MADLGKVTQRTIDKIVKLRKAAEELGKAREQQENVRKRSDRAYKAWQRNRSEETEEAMKEAREADAEALREAIAKQTEFETSARNFADAQADLFEELYKTISR